MKNKKNSWSVIIQPITKRSTIDLADIWAYKDLIWMLFVRDFTALYKQTILGPIWYLIQPTLTAMTFYVIFGKVANISTDGIHPFLFYMSGIVLWSFFSTCLVNNSETFSKNANLFGKVYFPRLVVPFSVVMSGLVTFCIQLLLLFFMILILKGASLDLPSIVRIILVIPLLAGYVAAAGMGVGLIVSAMTVRFRDLAFAIGFMTQLWMYATPVVYPFSAVPKDYYWFFIVNPMVSPIEIMRNFLFGGSLISVQFILGNLAVTIILLAVGLSVFSKAEANAIDTV